MTVSRVQFGSNSASSALSLTVTLGNPTTAGNLLVVMLITEGGPTPSSVALTGSSDTFTKDVTATSTDPTVTAINISCWSDPNCSGGHTAVVATPSSNASLLMMAWEASSSTGWPASPLAGTPAAAGNPSNTLQASFDSGAGASVAAGCFWAGAVMGVGSGGRALAVPSGSWTAEAALQPGSLSQMLGGYQAGPGAGAPEFSGTFSGPVAGAYWAAAAAAYKPVAVASKGLLMASII